MGVIERFFQNFSFWKTSEACQTTLNSAVLQGEKPEKLLEPGPKPCALAHSQLVLGQALDIDYNQRLENQLNFIVEIDKVKNIIRKSKLFDGGRFENDAEHSWTICIMALLLKEYSNFTVNIEKVISMLLIHDIVEIDAGDTFLYSSERKYAYIKERKAAERIFGLLDNIQKEYYIKLWDEFEEKETNEAKFAGVFDRLEPLIQNYVMEGYTWKKYNITYDMVIEKNKEIENGSKVIWEFVLKILDKALEKGYIKR
jgi:putative hydrolase of HD superfamily